MAKTFYLNRSLQKVTKYSDNFNDIINFNTRSNIRTFPCHEWRSLKESLYQKQKSYCYSCYEHMSLNDLLELHHVKPISEGGKKSKRKNLVLLHKTCHTRLHSARPI